MPVPYFSCEDNLTALKKMKVVFLIKQVRTVDFCILMTWIFPFVMNLIFFHLINGKNDVWRVFCPFGSIFKGANAASKNDWMTWYGSMHICALILTVFFRVVLSRKLLKKMHQYQSEQPSFQWNTRDKFWWFVYLPFVSFVIYPVLLKFTKFELVHKYNL